MSFCPPNNTYSLNKQFFTKMLGKIHEENRSESVYSGKRKSQQGGSMIASGVSEVRQRVNSARMLRFKSVQNQLSLAQQQIHDLEQENRVLLTTVRRQEKALDKYDNANAELPRLLKNHQEEIRVFQEKSKGLHKTINDLTSKLKQKDNALLVVTDQNKHLHQLNRDKQLENRVKLTEQVKELQQSLVERDNDLKMLARKNQLETKLLRSQFHQEHAKSKELQKKLDAANMEITRLNLLELSHGRGTLQRYRNMRETHSAATNISYRHNYNGSESSFYSKSPHCDSYRNQVLYEDQLAEAEDLDIQQKVLEFERQKKLHLQQVGATETVMVVAEEQSGPDGKAIEKIEEEEAEIVEQFKQLDHGDSDHQDLDILGRQLSLKKQFIDPQSKTKLLAALKAIDANDSFES